MTDRRQMTCGEIPRDEAPIWGAWGADGAFDATMTASSEIGSY